MNCCCRRGHMKKDPDLSVKIAFSTRSFALDCALAMSVSPGLWFSFRRVVKCLCYNSWTLCVLFLAVSSCGLFIWANFWGKNSVRSALSSGCIFKVDLKVFPTVFKAVLSHGVQPLIVQLTDIVLGILQVWIALGKINLDVLFCSERIFILSFF